MVEQTITLATFGFPAPIVSYILGPLDDGMLVEREVSFAHRRFFRLLVPSSAHLLALAETAAFQEGAASGYSWIDEELGTFPCQIVNWVYGCFEQDLSAGGSYEWVLGSILGGLTLLAETDRLLALVGMAHLCFLVALVPGRFGPAFQHALHDLRLAHDGVVRTHRAAVQEWRQRGLPFSEAWKQALVPVLVV